ncbi:hypothetical protein SAMN05421740_11470 [Parapedobacter koreensis]|uniref:Uncharacterized protein n=1 Tax=Parapedobacter koreensis TaxID=332977 RepID=A0A1H7UBL5_9SPHI|nr:hypothetical protein SAMN05421740_11470 [Parapedobacter koreensis]
MKKPSHIGETAQYQIMVEQATVISFYCELF